MRIYLLRSVAAILVIVFAFFATGCDIESRLAKPIDDFQAATTVVTAQARLAYGELNRVEAARAVKTAMRLHRRLNPKDLEQKVKVLSGEDLATRLDALDNLDKYAKLLSKIASSDLPDKIEESAAGLETALNGLAERINSLNDTVPPAGGVASAAQPNTAKFKAKFGIFAAVTREVLSFIAKKKRDDALKRAIRDGDAPLNELVDALRDDLTLSWVVKKKNLDDDMVLVFQTYNVEVTKPKVDDNRLNELGDAILANIIARDAFFATDPTEALDKLKIAHSKLIAYANRRTDASFTESVAAIDAFVSAATRLGAAVVKLRTINNQNS